MHIDKERFTLVGLNTNDALAKIAVVINRLLAKAPRKIGVSIPSVPYCFYNEGVQPGQVICSLMSPVGCNVRNLMFRVEDKYFKSATILVSLESTLGYEQLYSVDVDNNEDNISLPISLGRGDRITMKLIDVKANVRDYTIESLEKVWLSFTLDITRSTDMIAKLAVEALDEGV